MCGQMVNGGEFFLFLSLPMVLFRSLMTDIVLELEAFVNGHFMDCHAAMLPTHTSHNYLFLLWFLYSHLQYSLCCRCPAKVGTPC